MHGLSAPRAGSRASAGLHLCRSRCRDNKLGGVEGSKTPVLAHFDPPHEPQHATLQLFDSMINRLARCRVQLARMLYTVFLANKK